MFSVFRGEPLEHILVVGLVHNDQSTVGVAVAEMEASEEKVEPVADLLKGVLDGVVGRDREVSYVLIGALDQMEYLAFEHCDAGQNEVALVGVFDGPRPVQIEEVHDGHGSQGREDTAGGGTWPPQTANAAFPTVREA